MNSIVRALKEDDRRMFLVSICTGSTWIMLIEDFLEQTPKIRLRIMRGISRIS